MPLTLFLSCYQFYSKHNPQRLIWFGWHGGGRLDRLGKHDDEECSHDQAWESNPARVVLLFYSVSIDLSVWILIVGVDVCVIELFQDMS